MEKRAVNLEIRNSNTEERKIEGYAAVFSEEFTQLSDRWGDKFFEKISKGAFIKTLGDNERDKLMLINHDWNRVVGRTNSNLVLEEDEKGLRFTLTVPNTTEGNDLLENVRLGLIKGCSFGFNITKQITRWDEDWNFYREITEVDLFEISATPIPAYQDTEISARSDLSIKDLKEERAKELNADLEVNSEIEDKNNRSEENKEKIIERNATFMMAFFNALN